MTDHAITPLLPATLLLLAPAALASPQHSPRLITIGHSYDLDAVSANTSVHTPAVDEFTPIVGMSIAGSNDRVYVWYADGNVSVGLTQDFVHYAPKTPYATPTGKKPHDIITIAIHGTTDNVYAYYSDGTVSRGWSQDVGAYTDPVPFTLPPGKVPSDIVGIGSAGSNGHFYAWYADGTVSSGTPTNLGAYQSPYAYSGAPGLRPGHVLGMAITGSSDLVVTWYNDVERGLAHEGIRDQVDARVMDVMQRFNLPGMSVAVSKDAAMLLEKGYGYRNLALGARMDPESRGRIGSCSKVITALSAMKLHETYAGFSVSDPVYGPQGALSHSSYGDSQDTGINRHQPIVAKGIAANDHVYTWHHNGMVSSGTSTDADAYSALAPFELPAGMTPSDIRAIAIDPFDKAWVWYDNGSFSAGSPTDLDLHVPLTGGVSAPSGYSLYHVLGIGFANDGTVYTWLDDGTLTTGSVTDLDAYTSGATFALPATQSRYDIRTIAIAKSNNHVYTWLSGGTVLEGWSQSLGFYGQAAYWTDLLGWDFGQYWGDWYDGMRIDHLLSHTAGFVRSGDTVGSTGMFGIPVDNMSYSDAHHYMLRTRKMLFEPGTSARYSNHGLGLVGLVVSEVSGLPYRDYTRAAIIDPLGLDIRSMGNSQSGHDMWRHELQGGVPTPYIGDPTNHLGLAAGGWKSSAGDLVRLMLATDGKSWPADILAQETLDLMESRPYPGTSSYAHGWNKDSNGKLAHNGRLGGGTCYMAKFPAGYFGSTSQEITVAVCTNLWLDDDVGGSGVLTELAGLIAVVVDGVTIGSRYDVHLLTP